MPESIVRIDLEIIRLVLETRFQFGCLLFSHTLDLLSLGFSSLTEFTGLLSSALTQLFCRSQGTSLSRLKRIDRRGAGKADVRERSGIVHELSGVDLSD